MYAPKLEQPTQGAGIVAVATPTSSSSEPSGTLAGGPRSLYGRPADPAAAIPPPQAGKARWRTRDRNLPGLWPSLLLTNSGRGRRCGGGGVLTIRAVGTAVAGTTSDKTLSCSIVVGYAAYYVGRLGGHELPGGEGRGRLYSLRRSAIVRKGRSWAS